MLPKDFLRDLLAQDLSKVDKLLVCMAVDANRPKAVKEIVGLALDAGLRSVKKWNVSDSLGRARTLAVRTTEGWVLTGQGRQHVATLSGPLISSPIPHVASSLRASLSKIQNQDTVRFVEEAVSCFETRQYRAATVLSWVGAVSLLYDHVVGNCLGVFNSEATALRVNARPPWTPARNSDDLARLKEREFLLLLERCSVIGKSVRTELEKCLDLRNGSGHPNSLQLAEHVVAYHIEILILNVYSRF